MKKILITGVAGFIGSSLAEKLISSYEIVGLDDFSDYYSPSTKRQNVANLQKNKSFKIYEGDICDEKILDKIFRNHEIEKIVHLAARAGVRPSLENPGLYMKVNVLGTNNVLKYACASKIKQFIFASSSSVYGNSAKVPFSENDPLDRPISPYAVSKIVGEKLCWFYNNAHHLKKTTILRFFSVYGPKGRPDMAPYIFTRKILNNESINIYGDGSQARDFTYIDDIVDGIIKAIKKPFDFEIVNLGNSYPVLVSKLIQIIEETTGKRAKIKFQPARLGDVEKTYADISKAKKMLNWEPKTKIQEGINKFIDWLKNYNLYR